MTKDEEIKLFSRTLADSVVQTVSEITNGFEIILQEKQRCEQWGISLDEYKEKQCGDFTIHDMEKAYERGKQDGVDFAQKQIEEELQKSYDNGYQQCLEDNCKKKANTGGIK